MNCAEEWGFKEKVVYVRRTLMNTPLQIGSCSLLRPLKLAFTFGLAKTIEQKD